MNKVYIASRNGAVHQVQCIDNGSYVTISQKDLPEKTFVAFLDNKACIVEESGRFLDVLPTSDLTGHWFFSK